MEVALSNKAYEVYGSTHRYAFGLSAQTLQPTFDFTLVPSLHRRADYQENGAEKENPKGSGSAVLCISRAAPPAGERYIKYVVETHCTEELASLQTLEV